MSKISKFQNVLSKLNLKKPGENTVLDNLLMKPKKDNAENMPHITSEDPFALQQADLLFLPNDREYKYCLVVIDVATDAMDAEALKNKNADDVKKAMIKIYKRKYLEMPKVLQVDQGAEFKGAFESYFKDKFIIHPHVAGRHRQQAKVETLNKLLGRIIFRIQGSTELRTGNVVSDWVDYLPSIVKTINEEYTHKPRIIDGIKDLPRASGDSAYLLKVGTKVRIQLDNPQEINGKKLHGRFRATDIRWTPKIGTVTKFFLLPDQPPLYQVDNNDQVAYTKNQLQVVDPNEKLPPALIPEKYEVEKILKKIKKDNKIYFEIKWKGYNKTTIEPRTEIIKDVPEMVKAFEKKR